MKCMPLDQRDKQKQRYSSFVKLVIVWQVFVSIFIDINLFLEQSKMSIFALNKIEKKIRFLFDLCFFNVNKSKTILTNHLKFYLKKNLQSQIKTG